MRETATILSSTGVVITQSGWHLKQSSALGRVRSNARYTPETSQKTTKNGTKMPPTTSVKGEYVSSACSHADCAPVCSCSASEPGSARTKRSASPSISAVETLLESVPQHAAIPSCHCCVSPFFAHASGRVASACLRRACASCAACAAAGSPMACVTLDQ
jgi:hypothetical protein